MIAEQDQWTVDGAKITDLLPALQPIVDDETPLIVEHRFYRAGRSPERRIFDSYDDLKIYIEENAREGDHILLWKFVPLCTDEAVFIRAKMPDAQGRVPAGGAY